MKGLRLGLSLTGATAFTPASLTSVMRAWYDPSDLSTLFQDSAGTTPVTADGDPVGMIHDKSGNGNHLIQATAGSRPLYKVDGSGHSYLLTDGVDDVLSKAATALTLPFDRLTALQQVVWTLNRQIWGAASSAGLLYQNSASPQIKMTDGGPGSLSIAGPAVGTNAVITERRSANASRLAANNDAYAGPTDCGATSPSSINMGANAGGLTPSNVRIYGAIIGSFTDAQIASLRTWLGAKCGVVL